MHLNEADQAIRDNVVNLIDVIRYIAREIATQARVDLEWEMGQLEIIDDKLSKL